MRQLQDFENFSRHRAVVRALYVVCGLRRKVTLTPGEP